jgi:uncharacterized membrane protein YeiH
MGVILLLLFSAVLPRLCFSITSLRLQTAFLFADALGLGCYAVVGVEHALNAQLPILTAIMIGVVTACGGGLLRDLHGKSIVSLHRPCNPE